jgi:hypothetical protein
MWLRTGEMEAWGGNSSWLNSTCVQTRLTTTCAQMVASKVHRGLPVTLVIRPSPAARMVLETTTFAYIGRLNVKGAIILSCS